MDGDYKRNKDGFDNDFFARERIRIQLELIIGINREVLSLQLTPSSWSMIADEGSTPLK